MLARRAALFDILLTRLRARAACDVCEARHVAALYLFASAHVMPRVRFFSDIFFGASIWHGTLPLPVFRRHYAIITP